MNSIECDTIVTNRLTIGDANSESFIVMDSDSKSRRSSIKISGKNTIIVIVPNFVKHTCNFQRR